MLGKHNKHTLFIFSKQLYCAKSFVIMLKFALYIYTYFYMLKTIRHYIFKSSDTLYVHVGEILPFNGIIWCIDL